MNDLLANKIFIVCVIAWSAAQVLKVVYYSVKHRRINLRLLTSAGGMPSSHSALVTALAGGVAIQHGLHSTEFAIAIVFASIVMYDAAGVRRAVSRQAVVLNTILEELFQGHPIREERLRELIGHTPVEVIVGSALGIFLTWLLLR